MTTRDCTAALDDKLRRLQQLVSIKRHQTLSKLYAIYVGGNGMGIQRGVSGLLLWEGSIRLQASRQMGQFWRSDSDRCCVQWGYGANFTIAGKAGEGATPY